MVKVEKYVMLTLRWLVYLITILVIYMLILKLTNHRPLLETVVTGGVIAMIIELYKIQYRLGKIDTQVKNHTEMTRLTFNKVWQEFDRTNRKIELMDEKIPLVEIRLSKVEMKLDHIDERLARIEGKLGT